MKCRNYVLEYLLFMYIGLLSELQSFKEDMNNKILITNRQVVWFNIK